MEVKLCGFLWMWREDTFHWWFLTEDVVMSYLRWEIQCALWDGCKESGTYTVYNARYGQLRDRGLLTCLMRPSLSDKPQQDHWVLTVIVTYTELPSLTGDVWCDGGRNVESLPVTGSVPAPTVCTGCDCRLAIVVDHSNLDLCTLALFMCGGLEHCDLMTQKHPPRGLTGDAWNSP